MNLSWQRSSAGVKLSFRGRQSCPRYSRMICRDATQASSDYKKAAAALMVDKYVKSGTTLGLGSGELANLAIAEIGARLASKSLHSIVAVPSCNGSAASAAFNGVPLTTLEKAGKVDLAFEEVDQLDLAHNAAVKGVHAEPQQPQLLAVRELAQSAAAYVLLVDSENVVERLQGTLPVVVDGEGWEEPAEELDDIFLGDAELWRRSISGKANPRAGDEPYISPEGHNIIDIRFEGVMKLYGEEEPYSRVLEEITSVAGVVTHGLLLNMAKAVVIAKEGGQPEVVEL